MGDIVIGLVIGLAVALAIACATAIAFETIDGNDTLQQDYNRSIVECVKAGAEPLECKSSLLNGNR